MANREANCAVLVFAKIPGLGIAKSRIAATEGAESAARIYEELLQATAAILREFDHHAAFAGAPVPGPLREFFPNATSFIAQKGNGLGERLRQAFSHAFGMGYTHAIAVGCDCPYMTTKDLRNAQKMLGKGADIVLGPAIDGGYYLVGCDSAGLCIFDARNWSTAHLLEETLAIADNHGLKTALLTTRSDIDTISDYIAWKESYK